MRKREVSRPLIQMECRSCHSSLPRVLLTRRQRVARSFFFPLLLLAADGFDKYVSMSGWNPLLLGRDRSIERHFGRGMKAKWPYPIHWEENVVGRGDR